MSLLNIYVIFAYYSKAEKHRTRENKITKQQFDNKYIISKIEEMNNYHSSALHWNLKETKDTLPNLIEKVKKAYAEIENQLGVKFHNISGIEKFKKQFKKGVNEFMQISRQKAQEAQYREKETIQPKEAKLKGRLSSNDGIDESTVFFNKNSLNIKQKELIKKLFAESRENNFLILIEEV